MFDSMVVQPEGLGTDPAEVLAALAGPAAPGANAVAMATCLDPAELTDSAQIDLIVALDRQIAWLTAAQISAIAALDRTGADLGQPTPAADGVEFVALDLATALRLAPGTAQHRLHVARQLTDRLPVTTAALAAGTIGYWHAHAVVEATDNLTGPAAAATETRVMPRAGRQSVAELRRSLRRAVIAADPITAQTSHIQAAADRRVDTWTLPDGMAELRLTAPAEDVIAVYNTLTGLAHHPDGPDDPRGIDARRADILTTTILNAADHNSGRTGPTGKRTAEPPATGSTAGRHTIGQTPLINVTVAATTLLGCDDQPAELAGYGPITAHTARHLATIGTWRRILYDPADGQLLEYGRKTYRPPAALRAHINARDQTCTFPHCHTPATRCDIDHATPYQQGGTTDPANCGALCRHHHRAKTSGGWKLSRHRSSIAEWTSPTGHTYSTSPPSHVDP